MDQTAKPKTPKDFADLNSSPVNLGKGNTRIGHGQGGTANATVARGTIRPMFSGSSIDGRADESRIRSGHDGR